MWGRTGLYFSDPGRDVHLCLIPLLFPSYLLNLTWCTHCICLYCNPPQTRLQLPSYDSLAVYDSLAHPNPTPTQIPLCFILILIWLKKKKGIVLVLYPDGAHWQKPLSPISYGPPLWLADWSGLAFICCVYVLYNSVWCSWWWVNVAKKQNKTNSMTVFQSFQ